MSEWILARQDLLIKVLKSILVVAFGHILTRLLNNAIFKELKEFKKFDEGTANFAQRLAKLFEWFIILIIVLTIFEVSLGPLLTSLGIASIVLGFALKDVLSNLASGIMIMVYKPFVVGDFIQIGNDIRGTVKDIGISAMEIRTFANEKIVVSNSMVWANRITNFTGYPMRRIILPLMVPYGASVDKAIKVALSIIHKDKRLVDEPEPEVVVSQLTERGVELSIRAWVKTPDYWDALFDLQKSLYEQLPKVGIKIPFPQMQVHLKKD